MPELPITFKAAPIPEGSYTPNQFLALVVERLKAETQDSLALFAAGNTEPTSNVGPWLKQNRTWYVWDTGQGKYIPQPLDAESLKWIITHTTPDNTKYNTWFKQDIAGGAVTGVYFYAQGIGWYDIYQAKFNNYSTTAQMNTAIAAGQNFYPAAAIIGVTQAVPIDIQYHKIAYDTELHDLGNAYDPVLKRYTCPIKGVYEVSAFCQVDNNGGSQANMEFAFRIGKNGNPIQSNGYSGDNTPGPSGQRWYLRITPSQFRCEAGDYLEVFVMCQDTVNSASVNVANGAVNIKLVQKE